MRVAPSFMRFGSFEIWKEPDPYSSQKGPSCGLKADMQTKMLDYLLKYHYKNIDSEVYGPMADQGPMKRQHLFK